MTNEKRERPPDTHDEVVKSMDSSEGIDIATNSQSADTTLLLSHNSPSKISYDIMVPPFKFPKAVSTDDIVNVDADLIDMDSFQYVTKPALIKALVYFIKNIDQINKDLPSVSVPKKADFVCQWNGFSEENCCPAMTESSSQGKTALATAGQELSCGSQVGQLHVILNNFQSCLLQSVDEKLATIDAKMTNTFTQLTSDLSSYKLFPPTDVETVDNSAPFSAETHETSLSQSFDTPSVNVPPQFSVHAPSQLLVDIPDLNTLTSLQPCNNPSNADIIGNSSISLNDRVAETVIQPHSSGSSYANAVGKKNSTQAQQSSSNEIATTAATPSSSEQTCATKFGSAKTSAEVLVLSPNDNNSRSAENMNNVKKVVGKKLKDTQVEFMRTNPKSMKIVIGFKDTSLRDQGERIINSSNVLNSFSYYTKCATKMLPKITLHNVLSEVLDDVDISGDINTVRSQEKEAILRKILLKNPCIRALNEEGHTLEVVYLNKNSKNDFLTVGLKVSPSIRSAIIQSQQGNVYLGNSRYQFRDRFHFKHCYHCQMIGHLSMDCPDKEKPAVCMFCMKNHRSNLCPVKDDTSKHCCVRCLASKHDNDAENCKTHYAGELKCPVIEREITRLKENTEFTSKNLM